MRLEFQNIQSILNKNNEVIRYVNTIFLYSY